MQAGFAGQFDTEVARKITADTEAENALAFEVVEVDLGCRHAGELKFVAENVESARMECRDHVARTREIVSHVGPEVPFGLVIRHGNRGGNGNSLLDRCIVL